MLDSELTPSRIEKATQLIEDFQLTQDAEFFSEPDSRIAFLESLSVDDFINIALHANARVRGFEPREQANTQDKGGYLPLLGTPTEAEKPEAFKAGFDTIKSYLTKSKDTPEAKLKGAAMAVEALIIWVHPFNDGNGRTSRFLAKFIEDGTTDTEQLIAETADKNKRLRIYDGTLRFDQYNVCNGLDLILDDNEEAELLKTKVPVAEGISKSLKRLMENPKYQAKVDAKTHKFKQIRKESESQSAA